MGDCFQVTLGWRKALLDMEQIGVLRGLEAIGLQPQPAFPWSWASAGARTCRVVGSDCLPYCKKHKEKGCCQHVSKESRAVSACGAGLQKMMH